MSSCLIFYILLSSVICFSSSQSEPQSKNENLFIGKYPIQGKTPGPIDIETSEVKNAHLSPIKVTRTRGDHVKMINNGVAIEGIADPGGNAVLTGGPFFHKKYQYYKIRYYWSGNSSGPAATTVNGKNGTPIEALAIYYNEEYGSFENALNHRDGLAMLSARIRVTSKPNQEFTPFSKTLEKIVKPGSSAEMKKKYTFNWFDKFHPNDTSYFAYPSSYTDQLSGKKYYCSTVCILRPIIASISEKQFHESFGQLKNSRGGRLTNSAKQSPSDGRPIVQSSGFIQNAKG
ncbi:carbonic anhydrase 2-like [Planococcus citri]|uniref:carbonic anhydrase 2-like n=1 Tax=Planococcus citri TaxID=170843 RepID=UPI0031FA22E5